MRKVELTKGKFALVDDEDFERINAHCWQLHTKHLAAGRVRHSAIRTERTRESKRTIYMHREVILAPDGTHVDHIDRDPLNNCRSNLRLCTNSQNQGNVEYFAGAVPFKGVTFKNGRFCARIGVNRKRVHLGSFDCPFEAALAYDHAARHHFGDFACLNFPEAISEEAARHAERQIADTLIQMMRVAA